MLKKMMPFLLLSGLVLGACGTNNGALPSNNETPMEKVHEREKDWTPNVRDERRGGTNLDGLDDERDMNNNGVRNGVINDNQTTTPNNGGFTDGNGTTPNELIIEEEINPNTKSNNR